MKPPFVLLAGLGGALATGGCTARPLDRDARRAAIVGGTPVGDTELATVVSVSSNIGHVCTGTLISPTAILTAAHCVEPNFLKAFAKQQGRPVPDTIVYSYSRARDIHDMGTPLFVEAAGAEWHEKWDAGSAEFGKFPGKWEDVAVVHLKTPVRGRLQRLATADIAAGVKGKGAPLLIVGYGRTKGGDADSIRVLNKGTTQLKDSNDFEWLVEGGPQYPCHGDSGGPLFAGADDGYQIGIASRVTDTSACSGGTDYTRVDAYLPWIMAHVHDLGQELPASDDGGSDAGGPLLDAAVPTSDSGDPGADVNDAASAAPRPPAGEPSPPRPATHSGCAVGAPSAAPLTLFGLALSSLLARLRRRPRRRA